MKEINIKKILGRNLRELIKKRNFKNKTELAKIMNVNHRTIYDIYDDEGNPKLETIEAIAEKLKVPVWFLLQGTFSTDVDIKTLEKILSQISKLNAIEIAEASDQIEKIIKYSKIKETLASYEPSNPLVK